MMKRFVVPMVALLVFCATASADLSWQMVGFDSLSHGAVSYDKSGANIVTAGTAFHDTLTGDGYLGVQIVGGDGIDRAVEGNFGVYGVFNYTDTDNVLGWATANPDTLLAIEVRARGLQLDVGGDGVADLADNYKLNADDVPETYLTATFNELATWGYTEIAGGVWLDIALSDSHPGMAAMSVVIEDFVLHPELDLDSLEADLLAGALGGPVPGNYVGSGIRVAPVPVPGAVLLGILGLSAACPFCRRKAA